MFILLWWLFLALSYWENCWAPSDFLLTGLVSWDELMNLEIKSCCSIIRYDTYFFKVFKVYTELWKFQQENRQKLMEAGLKRWEIGEIASRIAQLYYGQYMRTSERSYLSESYIFYEAIFTREYFREGLFQDLNLANKQLRFLARFLMVCLVFNKREMVHQLVTQLKLLLDECKRTFQVFLTHLT